MTTKFEQYESELRSEHATLTKAYESSQKTAEAAWAEHEKHAAAISDFRAKYGRVLKALDEKTVVLTEGGK